MGMTDLPTSPYLATSDDAVGVAAYPITGRFRLADGRLVWMRPLQAEDAPRLMDLCKRLSPSTLRRRFLRSVVRCDPLEAQRLAAVDQVQRVALVAVPDRSADRPIVVVGRFHGDGSEQAELALLVDDVLYDNAPMLRLLRTCGQPLEVRWDSGHVLSVQLAVPGFATAAEPLPVPTKNRETRQ